MYKIEIKVPVGQVHDSGIKYHMRAYTDYMTRVEKQQLLFAFAKDGDMIYFDPMVEISVLNATDPFFNISKNHRLIFHLF